jgi:hypothetical protein
MSRGWSKRESLIAFFRAGWHCEVTGMPLIFPGTLCLLERLVACSGARATGAGRGYYDLREAMWNAPLSYMTYPASDHHKAYARDGETSAANLKVVALPVNACKSDKTLFVIPPHDKVARERLEREASTLGTDATVLYWPPASSWPNPASRTGSAAADMDQERKHGVNGRCNTWDGMLGVFLRLYHPQLPELSVEWNPRGDSGRNDKKLLENWYQTVFDYLRENPAVRERYDAISGGLWPAPMLP